MSDLPIGGTTGLDHESTAAIDEASSWFAQQQDPPHPVVPALRARFGLSAVDACAAIREGTLKRARAL